MTRRSTAGGGQEAQPALGRAVVAAAVAVELGAGEEEAAGEEVDGQRMDGEDREEQQRPAEAAAVARRRRHRVGRRVSIWLAAGASPKRGRWPMPKGGRRARLHASWARPIRFDGPRLIPTPFRVGGADALIINRPVAAKEPSAHPPPPKGPSCPPSLLLFRLEGRSSKP